MNQIRTITATSVDNAINEAKWWLRVCGVKEDSRNGPVIRAPGPVITQYLNPTHRLCFNPVRDANHVFHLMEAIWMLAGGSNVTWLLQYNSNFAQYAEADKIQHGAYGERWRGHFGMDQIPLLVNELKQPNSRRAVLGMWDPSCDLHVTKKDIPCNTHVYFQVQNDRLHMTVCCRSNDMVWGAYGANAVHFSMLQEVIAHELDVEIGEYVQFSNNFHLYLEMGQGRNLLNSADWDTHYPPTVPIMEAGEKLQDFLWDCRYFVMGARDNIRNEFLRTVALPLSDAYLARKNKSPDWRKMLDGIQWVDWVAAFAEWTDRREQEKAE